MVEKKFTIAEEAVFSSWLPRYKELHDLHLGSNSPRYLHLWRAICNGYEADRLSGHAGLLRSINIHHNAESTTDEISLRVSDEILHLCFP